MPSRPPQPAATLRELAKQRRLPAHQVMDQGTLDWIAANPPPSLAAPSLPRPAVMLLPEVDWFADPRLADSIHGVRHNARVSWLATVLAMDQGLDGDDAAALCMAAQVHDCRRLDDRDDGGHGQRAALWLLRNPDVATSAPGRDLPSGTLHRAAAAVALHDVSHEVFTQAQHRTYRQFPHVIDLLKAADCLDRYRLPLRHWWPDLTRLRIPVPAWLPPVAHRLVVLSEQAALDGESHQEALQHASRALNLGPLEAGR